VLTEIEHNAPARFGAGDTSELCNSAVRIVAKTKHGSKFSSTRNTRRGGTHRDVKRLRSGYKTFDRRQPAMNQESPRFRRGECQFEDREAISRRGA
jgi:hypothetical protein